MFGASKSAAKWPYYNANNHHDWMVNFRVNGTMMKSTLLPVPFWIIFMFQWALQISIVRLICLSIVLWALPALQYSMLFFYHYCMIVSSAYCPKNIWLNRLKFKSSRLDCCCMVCGWRIHCRPPRQHKVEVSSSFQVTTTTVWKQHPRSLHKGTTGRVWTGDQLYPVLCHAPALSDVESCQMLGRVRQAVGK